MLSLQLHRQITLGKRVRYTRLKRMADELIKFFYNRRYLFCDFIGKLLDKQIRRTGLKRATDATNKEKERGTGRKRGRGQLEHD